MFILPNLKMGGAERIITTICNHLPREKFQPSLLLFEKVGEYLDFLKEDVEIIEAHAMRDHIHMLVKIPPKIAVSSFMGYLKGKSSLMIFEKHANLKYKYGNRNFWAKGYYVSTVGLNTKVVEEYIRNQEKEDMIQDNLSKKEYVDPFKG